MSRFILSGNEAYPLYFTQSGNAVDLPGYGESEERSGNRESFLLELLESLSLVKPVIVSPSMSGRYSWPLVVNHSDKLSGFVAVAPVGIVSFEAQLQGVALPTLAIWGSNDSIVPVAQAKRLCQQMPDAELNVGVILYGCPQSFVICGQRINFISIY